ncbi:hypothetical protein SAMN05444274_103510 [Mariniphaga anaerophila]|uniref:Uncharacterized protein n=1 Tax=Mariniphaga anaerophila TaxID=1484053 RepID=A0A1M4YY57_9BACT|nr:hypothetical protein [Mariniphaga anaerophila]SHF10645.1 hypothetical protein SAMN05444274_103510 [Mariniphaga anaerophila]
MKKQILILAMFTLALVFAGMKSYGQGDINYIDAASTECVTPTTLDCADDDALHPIPGKTYTYGVTVNPTVTTGYIRWFVYNATANGADIITGGSIATAVGAAEADGGGSLYLLDAEDNVYNSDTNTQPTIDISWQSFNSATTEILLVAYVEGEAGCSDNIEVYRIQPSFSFTLDIAGLMPDGTLPASGSNANECVSPVQIASYDGTNLNMDYGENYIFFAVNAANFVHSWQPTFTIVDNGTETTVDISNIEWAYPDQAIANDGTNATGTWNAATAVVNAQDASGAVGDAGECIIVRVHLDHGTAENDANANRYFTLGVDGVMYDAGATTGNEYANSNLADLDPGTNSPCTNTETDQATYDLTPRPEIVTNTAVGVGDMSFEPKP